MNIGKNITAFRKDAGMTQEELAGQIGVSAQAVSKWENDVSAPDISMLPALAEAVLGMARNEKQRMADIPTCSIRKHRPRSR